MSDEVTIPLRPGQRIEWSRNDDPESFAVHDDTFDLSVIDKIVELDREPPLPIPTWTDPETSERYYVLLDGGYLAAPPEGWERFTIEIGGVEVTGYRRRLEG